MTQLRKWNVVAILALLMVVLAACGNGDNNEQANNELEKKSTP